MKITDILNRVASNLNSVFLYSSSYYENEKCYLCSSPDYEFHIKTYEEYTSVFEEIESLGKSHIIICLMNYEAGYLFEDKLNSFLPENGRDDLITLLCYKRRDCLIFNSRKIEKDYNSSSTDYEIENFRFNCTEDEYNCAIKRVKEYIYQGDTYQVNYTLKGKFGFKGNPEGLFLNLAENQSTRYSAFINLKDKFIISVSPELFFEKRGERIITRPMKGTLHRGINLDEDRMMIKNLAESEKDKAENVMIVDLLRNDFGRISKFGTVHARSLFDIEKYETVFQMTSVIEGELQEKSISRIIQKVFPCGSITGAPKIRTMEIIKELEKENRGLYTGSIGVIDGDDAVFNVAIRTLVLDKKSHSGEVGLGGGIVWDSRADKEFKEVILKGKFLTKQDKRFQLIETILFENGKFFLLDGHLQRLKASAEYFLFNCDNDEIKKRLLSESALLDINKKYKLRILLNKEGKITIDSSIIPENPNSLKVIISNYRINTRNKFQYFKTTIRDLYNSEQEINREKGFYETLFFNENEELGEGTFTNIFIFKNNEWSTPEIKAGILPGCYRQFMISKTGASENKISRGELLSAERVILVNSVRKEIPVEEIWENGKIFWKQKGGM